MFVGLSDTTVRPAKMAEPMLMPFQMLSRVAERTTY